MSYLVLARKLRPKTFRDIIGQEHIWKTLITAIKSNRVAHAFLFTGPRGTGKTSCARVLTKALNCLSPVDNEPCNTCENCVEINKGIATDVLEIDAASNRGIEHIRELREGVKFSPAKCAYKTYIIDEVHMLTTESFNALLKTLEEPPAHVKFILATTDHHKVPVTVISRCQRYDFTNISPHTMVQYLKKVAANESLNISESALMLIANHSAGGMRDALTTMDMLIGHSGNQIQDDNVVEILGLNNAKEIDELLYFIVERDLSRALGHFHSLTAKGRSLTQLITDLLRAVKDLSLVASLTADQIYWHHFLPGQFENYNYLAKQTTQATLQQYFQILLDIETQIKRSSQSKICAEMGIIKLCGVESIAGVSEVLTLLKEHAVPPKKKGLNLNNHPDLPDKPSSPFSTTSYHQTSDKQPTTPVIPAVPQSAEQTIDQQTKNGSKQIQPTTEQSLSTTTVPETQSPATGTKETPEDTSSTDEKTTVQAPPKDLSIEDYQENIIVEEPTPAPETASTESPLNQPSLPETKPPVASKTDPQIPVAQTPSKSDTTTPITSETDLQIPVTQTPLKPDTIPSETDLQIPVTQKPSTPVDSSKPG